MSDRVTELEAQVGELSRSLAVVEQRLAALERTGAPRRAADRSARPAAATAQPASAAEKATPAALSSGLSFVGRTLLVLAGAFVLRALTDSGRIPASLGVALGLAYASGWLLLADRAAAAGRTMSAAFHGAAAAAVAFPLAVEAAWRFKVLSAAGACAVLAPLGALALLSAYRRRCEPLAWIAVLAGTAASVAIGVTTGRLAPPLLLLVLLGTAALWLGHERDWVYLRWPVAIVTNLLVLGLVARAVRPGAAEGPWTARLVVLALLTSYLAGIAIRTLLLRRRVVPFEALQTAALTLVGLGGATYVASRSGAGAAGLGIAAAVLGAAAYAVAFAFLERDEKLRANFWFYTSIGLVYALAGTALVLPAGGLGLTWGALAAGAAALARRRGRFAFTAHAAAYGVAAAVASGLLSHAITTVLGSPASAWPPVSPGALAALLLAALAAWLTASPALRRWPWRLPRAALVAAVLAGTVGVAAGWLVPLAAGSPGPGADAGVAATARTVVLVLGTLALAWVARSDAWVEARWLVAPALAVGGVKLLLEDAPRSRPATLFVAFALYGAALLVIPRLRRRPPAAALPPSPAAPR